MKDKKQNKGGPPQPPRGFRFHGGEPRGINHHPSSSSFEGRFGRMFRTLAPAKFDENILKALAKEMMAEHEDKPTPESEIDGEENMGIDAGYTYLGQFIDHDLTFDPASSLERQNDPDALVDFRTPRFDLDCMYGRGPADQPYLYQPDGLRMLLGRKLTGNPNDPNTRDLPRNTSDPARALIGDPRNDENVIVSQLHATMLRFHNRVVEHMKSPSGRDSSFEEAQKQVRWHYQWVVLHDFLPTIAGQKIVDKILESTGKGLHKSATGLSFFKWREFPFMPIEFSAAAYRFGHSMVRPIYRLNTTLRDRQEIFSQNPNKSLTGFREFPSNWAIEWSLFFAMTQNPPLTGKDRLQKAYKIDSSLVNPLGHLPPSIGGDIPSLMERNLIRGWRMGLPSGQAVSRLMGVQPIPDANLKVGKATVEDSGKNKLLTKVSDSFSNNAPLWYYILAEAQQAFDGKDSTPITLGEVGGSIVAEVFIGLLLGDTHSFLVQDPTWQPLSEFKNSKGEFKMSELIAQAMKA